MNSLPIRYRYTVLSLLLVSVTYAIYFVAIVPWIDPTAKLPETDPGAITTPVSTPADTALEDFQELFPVGSWERDKPIILENEQAKFILQDYENLRDGRVKLTRCSIIFMPAGEVDFARPEKRFIILQTTAGAILQFDTPIDLARLKVGKLVGGQLLGQVRIVGTPSRPGADDAIEVLTSNVQTNEERLWTGETVTARLGPHQLSGTELNLRWLPGTTGSNRRGPNVGGIESLELLRDVRMKLQPGVGGLLPGDQAPTTLSNNTPKVEQPPIDIRCAGSFEFKLTERYALFSDQVAVLRQFPNGVIDQALGDKLRIEFQTRDKSNQPANLQPLLPENATTTVTNNDSRPANSLEPKLVQILGHPARVRAPSTQVEIDADHIEYNLVTRGVLLDGKSEIQLRQAANHYRGRRVSYEPGTAGKLGRLIAQGPGKLHAINNDSTKSQIDVEFETSLKLRPHEQNQVLSILGKANVVSSQFGQIAGDELHLWLIETPPKPKTTQPSRTNSDLLGSGTVNAIPDRLLANGDVKIRAPQIHGDCQKLEIWFDATGQLAAANSTPEKTIVPLRTNDSSSLPVAPPTLNMTVRDVTPGAASGISPVENKPLPTGPRYQVLGELIRVQFAYRDKQNQVENVTIQGAVDFREPSPTDPRQPNLWIQGEHLEVLQASLPTTQATVTGKPAKIMSRGIETQGDVIRLDRAQNRVWVEGAGQVKLPENKPRISTPPAANAVPNNQLPGLGSISGPVSIDFKKGMTFDGQQILIDQDILIRMDQTRIQRTTTDQTGTATQPTEIQLKEFRTIRTQQVLITLKERVDLQRPAPTRPTTPQSNNPTAQVDNLRCLGGFVLETRTDDAQGQPWDWQQLQARDLTYEPTSGNINGTGPGELISVRRQQGQRATTNPLAANPAQANKTQLQYLRIEYRRALAGNLLQRRITFDNQIQAIAGGINSWAERLDADKPELLGPQDVILQCEQLVVAESPATLANQPSSIELQAIGNTVIEGSQFTGRGYRLTYAQGKDQLVLEGDGRNDAVLNYQQGPGLPLSRAAAGRLMYWPGSNRVDVDGGRMIDLTQLQPAKPQPDKK